MSELEQVQALPRRDIYGDAFVRLDDVVAILEGRYPPLPADAEQIDVQPAGEAELEIAADGAA